MGEAEEKAGEGDEKCVLYFFIVIDCLCALSSSLASLQPLCDMTILHPCHEKSWASQWPRSPGLDKCLNPWMGVSKKNVDKLLIIHQPLKQKKECLTTFPHVNIKSVELF